jgi:hypothetical protein
MVYYGSSGIHYWEQSLIHVVQDNPVEWREEVEYGSSGIHFITGSRA